MSPIAERYPPTSSSLPTGTLTYLFTDVEGSTRLWEQYPDQMRGVMIRHDDLIESLVTNYGGSVVRPRGEGDSRFAVFPRAADAVAAASAIQRALSFEAWIIPSPLRVRMGLHTGAADLRDNDYYGPAVNRCARLRNAARGGQVLVSQNTNVLVRDALPEGVSMRDLGEYRLKDLNRTEHIYQLVIEGLPGDFPPLKALENLHTNLPAALTSFVGREREIEEVKQLLTQTRLLTIAGVGGAGKTRVALQVAEDLLEFFGDGVWWMDLAPISNPELIIQFVADVLGIREEAGKSLLQLLTSYMRTKNTLLVMDNCEHLIQGVALFVETILRSAPELRILATSREALGMSGEVIWRIPPLSAPGLRERVKSENLVQYEAVKLFVERAVAVKADFEITVDNARSVAKICARLDGIPLAIELAAARVRVLSVEEIAERLDDRFRLLVSGNRTALPRQQTLRALLDWSHELLSEHEQILLRRLSIFTGGWTLPAAEKVCFDEEVEAWQILELLTHLIDKSLVVAESHDRSERYRYLETIRQYAQERLLEAKEVDELACKHAEYFLNLAEEAYSELWGPRQATRLVQLEAEHENLRMALEYMSKDGSRAEMLLRLGSSLWRFWEIRGYISEGRAWLKRALDANPDAPAYLRGNGLRGAGILACQQGDYMQAKALHEQSLTLFRELGNKLGIARELNDLGEIARYLGNYQEAVALHTESLALRYEIDDKEGLAVSLGQLGTIALDRGQHIHARELLEEGLKLNRELGDKQSTALSLNNLGLVSQLLSDFVRAISLFEEALSLYRELKDKLGISNALLNLGSVAKDQGYFKQATTLLNECLVLKQEVGDRRGIGRIIAALAEIAVHQGNYARGAELAEQSLKIFRELGVKRGMIISLEVRVYAANHQGDYDLAQSLASQALTLANEIGAPRGIAYSKAFLGLIAYAKGNLTEALKLLHSSLDIFRDVGDRKDVAYVLVNLARVAYRQGDNSAASQMLEESLTISRELDIRWGLAFSLEIMGLLQRSEGHNDQAFSLFKESLILSAEQENLQGILNCLGALAGLAAMTGQPSLAARLFAVTDKMRDATGARMGSDDRMEYERYLSVLRNQMSDAEFESTWSGGYAMTTEQAIAELEGWSINPTSHS